MSLEQFILLMGAVIVFGTLYMHLKAQEAKRELERRKAMLELEQRQHEAIENQREDQEKELEEDE